MLATCLLAGLLNYSSTLKMEAIRSSETSVTTLRTARRHISEEDTLHVKSYFSFFLSAVPYCENRKVIYFVWSTRVQIHILYELLLFFVSIIELC
jgi:hypothetical protein